MLISQLQTPALVVERSALEHNVSTMAAARPGERLRPHVKAHKSTRLARVQAAAGHRGFTCATIREVEGMAAAGLGDDLLLANEILDTTRLDRVAAAGARITLAVDSEPTIEAAASGDVHEVLVDVNVGLPRCGCEPDQAGSLAEMARRRGLIVRGVMGYEGHAVGLEQRDERLSQTDTAMALLRRAHDDVGGEVISAGATGTYDINDCATEIQAGSYVLMDTAYAKLGLPFRPALAILATVISVNPGGWAVADCGLKALGMDHGNPSLVDGGVVWYCSDEHVTFSAAEGAEPYRVGQRVRLLPAHIDPTVAYHEAMHLVDADEVLESWPVDLRGW
ncbi:MAG TPA: alanine racemase [Acidimicrobiales bacterium]